MGIPPTGKSVTVSLIDVNRIEGGRLAERWAETDMLGMLQQLGVIPGPAAVSHSAVTEDATSPNGGDPAASKTVARRFVDQVINRGDLAAVNDLVTGTYVYHGPGLEVRGPEGIIGVMAMLRTAFPDWRETLEDLIAEGDKVVFRVTGHATHEGEFFGVQATSRRVTMGGLDLVHVEGGRLAEHWANFDQLGLMQQLGAIPRAAQAMA
jgi:predicted ester cyclase